MKKAIIIFLFSLILYIIIITNTKISFVGYWSDIFFSITMSVIIISLMVYNWKDKAKLNGFLKIISFGVIVPFLIILGIIINGKEKFNRFDYQNINDKNYTAYLYEPYGVWEGENGILKISIKSKKIPFLELNIGNYLPPKKLYKKLKFEKNYLIQKIEVKKFIIENIINYEMRNLNHLNNLKKLE